MGTIDIAEFVELISQSEFGVGVSRAKLLGWRRAGLFPFITQSGRGRGKGSQIKVEIIGVEQAQTIAALLKVRRDYNWIGWHLWLMDYSVAEKYWLPRLRVAAEVWDFGTSKLCEWLDADDDQLSEISAKLLNLDSDDAIFKGIRKALGPKRFATGLQFVFELAAGYFSPPNTDSIEAPEYRSFAKLADLTLGLVRSRTDHVSNKVTLLLNDLQKPLGDYLPLLSTVSTWLASVSWVEHLQSLSHQEIYEARREVVNMLGYIAVSDAAFEALFGPDAFGLRRAAKLRGALLAGNADLLLVGWLLLRQMPDLAGGINRWREALESSGLPPDTNMARLRIAVPTVLLNARAKLKQTRVVFPYQEWVDNRNKS